MTYRVIWTPDAENDVLQLLNYPPNVAAVVAAVQQLDFELENAANQVGESREGPNRIVLYLPVGARFTVDDASHTAVVNAVWLTRRL